MVITLTMFKKRLKAFLFRVVQIKYVLYVKTGFNVVIRLNNFYYLYECESFF